MRVRSRLDRQEVGKGKADQKAYSRLKADLIRF